MKLEFLTKNPSQTKMLGEALAREIIIAGNQKQARILGLVGDLGGGKTTFLQGFAKGLGVKERVLSPTFVIFKKFKLKSKLPFDFFYHMDCYRLFNKKDLTVLGFDEVVKDQKNIIAAEWSDKVVRLVPKDGLIIKFVFINENTRKISILSA